MFASKTFSYLRGARSVAKRTYENTLKPTREVSAGWDCSGAAQVATQARLAALRSHSIVQFARSESPGVARMQRSSVRSIVVHCYGNICLAHTQLIKDSGSCRPRRVWNVLIAPNPMYITTQMRMSESRKDYLHSGAAQADPQQNSCNQKTLSGHQP